MQSTKRHPKGTVAIINSNNRLQLRFNYAGKRYYISLGLPDTKANRRMAEGKASLIESDIRYERVDLTLEKYKPQADSGQSGDAVEAITPIPTPVFPIEDLWEKYTQHRVPQITGSTLVRDYGKIAKRLKKVPKTVNTASGVRDWLLKNYSPEVGRRTLIQLNACFKWAVDEGLVHENGFSGMARTIKKVVKDDAPQPFTTKERDAIIRAFEQNRYSSTFSPTPHSFYANYVKFLFMTGCRPEEAVALRWKHVSNDCDKIRFEEAIPSDTGIRGPLKTGKPRTFPCNEKLQVFMASIKPEQASALDPVFPAPRGKEIDSHNFLNRVWRKVVEKLVEIGEVEQYLPQYSTRDTFITLALENGLDVKDVAYLVGNSPGVIYKHYAGRKRNLTVPDF